MALIGPRFGILVWWLLDSVRWERAFANFWWAFLGFIFLPWTTIFFVLVWSPAGLTGFDWIILGLGVLLDIASYSTAGYERRIAYAEGV